MTCEKCGTKYDEGGFTLDTNGAFLTLSNGIFRFCGHACCQQWYTDQCNKPSEVKARMRQYIFMAGEYKTIKTA